jgi:hypothetical protein
MQVITIGLDLAKTVFQVHAVNAKDEAVIRRSLRRKEVLPFFRGTAPVPGGDGDLRDGALLGARDRTFRP